MRILIVDDEFVALTKMVKWLSEYGQCDVATNGKQAYDMFLKALGKLEPYDLITIDIVMPGINGFMLLKLICAKEQNTRVTPSKKIMVSEQGCPSNVIHARIHHCDAFIVKPVKKEILKNKLIEIGIINTSCNEPIVEV